MRLLLTGASGFVGRNLREALSARHEVLAPTHGELDLLDGAAVGAFLRRERPDVVLHAAVKGGDTVLEQTLRMQANLVGHLGRDFGRLIYFGSGAEYAKDRDLRKISDNDIGLRTPKDPYGLAKLYCCEQARAHPGPIVNLRLFGVFGPHEGYLYKFISNAIAKALLGLPVVIRQDVRFDYLWIEDLVPIVEWFLKAPAPLADCNVTPTESITLTAIVDRIRELAGGRLDSSVATPGMNFEYTGSNDRLLMQMPDLTFTPMRDAIAKLWRFYEAQKAALDRQALVADDYAAKVKTRNA